MAQSPGSQPRPEVAPPSEPEGRLSRTGYLALAVSGLVVVTALAAVAQVLAPQDSPAEDRMTAQTGRTDNSGATGGAQVVPGEAVPGQTTVLVDGVAVSGTMPPTTTSRTTTVSDSPDRKTRTSEQPPPSRTSQRPTSSGENTTIPPTNTKPTTTTTTTTPSPTSSENTSPSSGSGSST
ncbi:hypothetical protein FHU38_003962 [Saccharomonospora amisosensis]|uniref:Uncharacterized protein n=1 Tax=Saccharomonospora amisosensis TaxID=1128677 RepID=A0A7X5UTX1_9PSEU|nr:hypothetical protein [Saccharomonospora amisosensis]NIJ13618.1 hypothetical protein [Saccharomonospora amisosensis]